MYPEAKKFSVSRTTPEALDWKYHVRNSLVESAQLEAKNSTLKTAPSIRVPSLPVFVITRLLGSKVGVSATLKTLLPEETVNSTGVVLSRYPDGAVFSTAYSLVPMAYFFVPVASPLALVVSVSTTVPVAEPW